MNSILSRLNGVFAFALTVMGVVTALCYFSTMMNDRSLTDAYVEVYTRKPIIVRSVETRDVPSKSDLSQFNIEINADLTKMFDWNTKEVFVYAVASYETDLHPVNEVVLWDKIIRRGENPVIKNSVLAPEYYFLDYGSGLRGKNVSLQLVWNLIPFAAGHLPIGKSKKTYYTLPDTYSSQY